ncbi:hypothetical protein LT85_0091 [Collimonas arenae]|uniref:DUF1127 domain-containing protein n=1 Tax=Collimonas arenae TaxID=279058 RepID=A0A0A1F421_9BURK|nr:hypothetical protein LT85_0091 [Collimonas arenae]
MPGSPLQNLPSFLKLIGGWWAQRLETQPARPLITLDDLSDHVLRDIGYLDSVPLRKHTHRTKDY